MCEQGHCKPEVETLLNDGVLGPQARKCKETLKQEVAMSKLHLIPLRTAMEVTLYSFTTVTWNLRQPACQTPASLLCHSEADAWHLYTPAVPANPR